MKKTFRIIICILLLLLVSINVYLGRLFILKNNEKEELLNDKNKIEDIVSDKEESIKALNDKYNKLMDDENNSNLILEYDNWQRHLEKLKEIMDY